MDSITECIQHIVNIINTYQSLKGDMNYPKVSAFNDLRTSKKAMAVFNRHYSSQILEEAFNHVYNEITQPPNIVKSSSPPIATSLNFRDHQPVFSTSTFTFETTHDQTTPNSNQDYVPTHLRLISYSRNVDKLDDQSEKSLDRLVDHDFDSDDDENNFNSEEFFQTLFYKREVQKKDQSEEEDDDTSKNSKKKSKNSLLSKKELHKDQCRDYMIGWCRFENIRYLGKCKFKHDFKFKMPESNYTLTPVTDTIEFKNIKNKFENTFDGGKITVTEINKINNEFLKKMYEQRKKEITKERGSDKVVPEMRVFHGTSEAALPFIFKNGLHIPSDYSPDRSCPVSGNLTISICKTDCKLCMNKHVWHRCHMFGLGAYFATKSSKSDSYVSDANGNKNNKIGRKMLLCNIFPGVAEVIDTNMSQPQERHDKILPAKGCDSVFAKGLGAAHTQGLGVVNDEYIIFNRYQCLPLYEIKYDKK